VPGVVAGPGATVTEVTHAMCWDDANVAGTNPVTVSIGTLGAASYGWSAAVVASVQGFLAQDRPPGG